MRYPEAPYPQRAERDAQGVDGIPLGAEFFDHGPEHHDEEAPTSARTAFLGLALALGAMLLLIGAVALCYTGYVVGQSITWMIGW